MITLTKEQLIASAHARIEFAEMMLAGELEPLKERTWSIELGLARIALASLEAEPSYFVNRVKHSDAYGEDVELRTYCYELDALKSKDDFGGEIVPVYTVPPAPFALPVQHWEELCRQNPDMSIGDAIIRAAWWNHCAAMLQGADGKSPVISDGWKLVPIELTPRMITKLQQNTEIGSYIAANWAGAYDLFQKFWDEAIAAAPQQEA